MLELKLNLIGLSRSKTSDTRLVESSKSWVFKTAKFSMDSGNKVFTAGKFPLMSLEVTDLLFALKAIKSFSSEGFIEIEISPWLANVLAIS